MQDILNYIDGALVPPASGEFFANYEPATGLIYSRIPNSDERDVQMAVEAARRAAPAWGALTAEERAAVMLRIADAIDANLDTLAMAESVDNGKPLSLARSVDIPRASANFRYFAHAITQFHGDSFHTRPGLLNYTLRQPLGIAGCISPWNLPLYLFTWKIAPALAAGNAVVAKPSEVTPMTAFLLSRLCREAGLPAGVLNIVHGTGPQTGAAIVAHPEIKAISFTGGTATGRAIASIAAPMFKKLSLELGGKNPAIVFADADFESALSTVARAAFANQGQICLCGSRILVERSLYTRFRDALVEKVAALRLGDPLADGTQQGALVSEQHMNKVLQAISLAKEEGGTILTGGERVHLDGRCANGWFVQPTLIEGLHAGCRTNQEEIFGPVATIIPFDTEQEALAIANSTEYGLAATVWTTNLQRAHRVAEKLHSGIVWVNCWLVRDLRTPFGGVKNSGVGREGGLHALDFFTEPKNVCIEY